MSNQEMWKAANLEAEKYKSAIGKLVLAFNDLEAMLHNLLLFYGNISRPVGRALFSGTRTKAFIDNIKAVADNTKIEEARIKDLEDIFGHVAAINTMRDFIVHHTDGSEQQFDDADPSTRVVTDARRVRRPENAVRRMIGSAHIEAMADDIITACWRMQVHTDRSNNPFQTRNDWRTRKPYTWLYKPHELKTLSRRIEKLDRKQQRPQKSSRG